MATIQMVMPKMGESIMEGTILNWLKKEGDTIEQDESILEVATDKVDTEVPSTHSGVLKEILKKAGEVVPVGHPIAVIEVSAEVGESETVAPDKPVQANIQSAVPPASMPVAEAGIQRINKGDRFYSPLVLKIAKEEGVSVSELEAITGTGVDQRVTKKDILQYLDFRKSGVVVSKTNGVESATIAPAGAPVFAGVGDEIIEMDRMRKMIAQRMVDSKRISAHVTSFVEADVTGVVFFRNRVKKEFQEKEKDVFTFTPIFIEAVVKALKDYPAMNASVDGDRIILKKDINIGVAVALPSGNLIVPVIKNADQYNLIGLTKQVNDIARRARENKLTPDDLSGGTYTVSNVGSFGNVMGTPIINQPQIGILAVGAIRKKPAVIETPYGDTLGIRHMMFLSHSYDHRVVDGALGGMFVRRVADYLEQFDMNRKLW
jgi:2-oxoglutarate dehydrogenase E2 component (dihydrolipoamide succinyltransferase)